MPRSKALKDEEVIEDLKETEAVAKKGSTKKTKTTKSSTSKKSTAKTNSKKLENKSDNIDEADVEKTARKTSTAKKSTTKASTSKKLEDKSDVVDDADVEKTAKKTTRKTSTTKKSTTKASTSKKLEDKSIDTIDSVAENKKAKTSSDKKSVSKPRIIKRLLKKIISLKKDNKSESVEDENVEEAFENIPEYYDLPYRYNQTVVKVLYQNPTTLFVYWDVSDEDIENFKKQYGENFLYITKPVLLVHNLTDNYSFELDINDFANNWYIHVNNSKCKYSVELCRRPSQSDSIENLETRQHTDFINITYSNTIELPNDHVLFFKNNDKIYFKNIKTNKITEKIFKTRTYGSKVKAIYNNYDLTEDEDRFDFKNPSSQNPTSNVM